MISQPGKGNRIPTVTGVYDASGATLSNGVTTEQTILSITGTAALLNLLSFGAGVGGANATIRVKVDGVTVYSVTVPSGSSVSDLMADTASLRRAFPNGIAGRSSVVVTYQLSASGAGVHTVFYNAVSVDSLA